MNLPLTYAAPVVGCIILHGCPVVDDAVPRGEQTATEISRGVQGALDIVQHYCPGRVPPKNLRARPAFVVQERSHQACCRIVFLFVLEGAEGQALKQGSLCGPRAVGLSRNYASPTRMHPTKNSCGSTQDTLGTHPGAILHGRVVCHQRVTPQSSRRSRNRPPVPRRGIVLKRAAVDRNVRSVPSKNRPTR